MQWGGIQLCVSKFCACNKSCSLPLRGEWNEFQQLKVWQLTLICSHYFVLRNYWGKLRKICTIFPFAKVPFFHTQPAHNQWIVCYVLYFRIVGSIKIKDCEYARRSKRVSPRRPGRVHVPPLPCRWGFNLSDIMCCVQSRIVGILTMKLINSHSSKTVCFLILIINTIDLRIDNFVIFQCNQNNIGNPCDTKLKYKN